MDKKKARSVILNKPFSIKDIETPFWPELDGFLCIRAISAYEGVNLQSLVGNPTFSGKLLQESLYLRGENGERIGEQVFEPADRDSLVAQIELGIMEPLLREILVINGMQIDGAAQTAAIDAAKKN